MVDRHFEKTTTVWRDIVKLPASACRLLLIITGVVLFRVAKIVLLFIWAIHIQSTILIICIGFLILLLQICVQTFPNGSAVYIFPFCIFSNSTKFTWPTPFTWIILIFFTPFDKTIVKRNNPNNIAIRVVTSQHIL